MPTKKKIAESKHWSAEVKEIEGEVLASFGKTKMQQHSGMQQIDYTNFTVMRTSCICGKQLTLKLQPPSTMTVAIQWWAHCEDCKWQVTFSASKR